jgi:hypothetical protein
LNATRELLTQAHVPSGEHMFPTCGVRLIELFRRWPDWHRVTETGAALDERGGPRVNARWVGSLFTAWAHVERVAKPRRSSGMMDYPKLTSAQKRAARIAAMERTFQRTSERAADALQDIQAEIERSHDLLNELAHLSVHGGSGSQTSGE